MTSRRLLRMSVYRRTSGEIAARFQVSALKASGRSLSMFAGAAPPRVDDPHALRAVVRVVLMEEQLPADLHVVAATRVMTWSDCSSPDTDPERVPGAPALPPIVKFVNVIRGDPW